MLSRLLGEKRVYLILVLAYSALAIGITFNKVILSIATMLLFALVLFDFNYKKYKEAIKKSKLIQVLFVFLAIHLLSFFWSENTSFFLKDLNSKLPLYIITLVFILKPLKSKKDLFLIFALFLTSLTVISALNFISYYAWRKIAYDDIRNLSFFISHIRFGLMILFGLVLSIFWLKSAELKYKTIPIVLIIWFLTYTYFSEVFSSYLALVGMLFVSLFFQIKFSSKKRIYLILLSVIFLFTFFLVYKISNDLNKNSKKPVQSELKVITANGNLYEHDLNSNYFINGNFVFVNICRPELLKEWYKVSKVRISDYNVNSHKYYYLLKYMASKGLTKDSLGFQSLNISDIHKIENGITNFKDEDEGFFHRINTLKNEFSDEDPNGKTILQRVEYVKAGISIFKTNWLLGVGSGDIQDEFNAYYEKTNSKLKEENRLRTHNQILSYFISFGIIGGIIFVLLFVFSFKLFLKEKSLAAILFLVIILVSFLSEDTLETQMGATFFALFFGIFISSNHLLKSKIKSNEN